MDFRILGPLEVSDGDRQVGLGGARQRALLGMLLLHANEVVSNDRLIEELWPQEGLENGSKALQVAVSRLRKALEPDRPAGEVGLIVTRPPGYELRLEPERLDLRRFETMVADGRESLAAGDPGAGAATLSEALALWRGEPLADLAYESFCQSEISRLEELRAAAHEDRIAADLELGRHADLVAELQDLVAQQPLRERPRRQLILALYRSGRQAEALAAYQEARDALVEELGIEPGRELQQLQQAILQQDPGLEGRPPPESPPAPSRGAFVGRERELAELVGALDDALAGRGRLALVAGEPGIGKSRLADELMRAARADGARVLVGRCWEAGARPRIGRGCSRCARTFVRRSRRRCERSSAPAQRISPSSFPSCASSSPSFRSRRRWSRRAPASVCSRRRAPSCGAPRRPARLCSCLTTFTPRTSPRCFCFGSSLASWATAVCSWCVRSATSIQRCGIR